MKASVEENTPISTEVLLQNGFTSIITKDFKSKDIDLFRSLIYLIGRNPYEEMFLRKEKLGNWQIFHHAITTRKPLISISRKC